MFYQIKTSELSCGKIWTLGNCCDLYYYYYYYYYYSLLVFCSGCMTDLPMGFSLIDLRFIYDTAKIDCSLLVPAEVTSRSQFGSSHWQIPSLLQQHFISVSGNIRCKQSSGFCWQQYFWLLDVVLDLHKACDVYI